MNKERARDRAAKIVANNWRLMKRLPRITRLVKAKMTNEEIMGELGMHYADFLWGLEAAKTK